MGQMSFNFFTTRCAWEGVAPTATELIKTSTNRAHLIWKAFLTAAKLFDEIKLRRHCYQSAPMSLQQALHQLEIVTSGEGFIDLTQTINRWIAKERIERGVLHLTALHTSCSLTINENADPRVLDDLSTYMKALVPEEGFRSISGKGGAQAYRHADEGPDDMPAHIRTSLTSSSLSLSIDQGKLLLGIWQAIYLWEHRCSGSRRRLALHAIGEMTKP
jgi:secondary thiamine-phosphate synthase enzyme